MCDWWQNFRCQDTPNFYQNNDELYKTPARSPEVANNQLRKRTDTIEREEETPFSEEVVDDSDGLSDENGLNSEIPDEVSSPAPLIQVSPVGVKGYSDKQVVTTKTVQSAGIKSGRVMSYGARMTRKRTRGDKLAVAAASKSKLTTLSPGNFTEVVSKNVETGIQRMSTSALPLPVN